VRGLTAALGRLLLEVLRHGDGVCLVFPPGIAQTIVRFTENILARTTVTSPTPCANWRSQG